MCSKAMATDGWGDPITPAKASATQPTRDIMSEYYAYVMKGLEPYENSSDEGLSIVQILAKHKGKQVVQDTRFEEEKKVMHELKEVINLSEDEKEEEEEDLEEEPEEEEEEEVDDHRLIQTMRIGIARAGMFKGQT